MRLRGSAVEVPGEAGAVVSRSQAANCVLGYPYGVQARARVRGMVAVLATLLCVLGAVVHAPVSSAVVSGSSTAVAAWSPAEQAHEKAFKLPRHLAARAIHTVKAVAQLGYIHTLAGLQETSVRGGTVVVAAGSPGSGYPPDNPGWRRLLNIGIDRR